MYRITIAIFLIMIFVAVGCDKSSESPPVVDYPDSADLLGLKRNHTLHYVIYDSIVTYIPDYSVTIDTTDLSLEITEGEGNQVELTVDGTPHDVLTVDPLGVLHTGLIRYDVNPPETLFYTPTPIIMPREYAIGSSWSVISPQYDEKSALLFLNYGYLTQRTFEGKIDIVLPTNSYESYYFKSCLFFNETSPDTMMVVDEYYADNVGLVKLLSRGGGSRRLIILLDDE